jgi:hypothetical protein
VKIYPIPAPYTMLPGRYKLYNRMSILIEVYYPHLLCGRTDNTMAKRKSTKGQTTIYKTYT